VEAKSFKMGDVDARILNDVPGFRSKSKATAKVQKDLTMAAMARQIAELTGLVESLRVSSNNSNLDVSMSFEGTPQKVQLESAMEPYKATSSQKAFLTPMKK
jgi:hypothetical protein